MHSNAVTELIKSGFIDGEWQEVLLPVTDLITEMMEFLERERSAGHTVLPEPANIFKALQIPPSKVKVVVVGQDPYPTPGHAMGLSFSVHKTVKPIPRSLKNIYQELRDDLQIEQPTHGDLSDWAKQGVLLLNRVLTVRARAAGSHANRGWEAITSQIISGLIARNPNLVFVLWGNQARSLKPDILGRAHTIESAHPSPLSARRGFFGSKPFSRINEILKQHKIEQIDWKIS